MSSEIQPLSPQELDALERDSHNWEDTGTSRLVNQFIATVRDRERQVTHALERGEDLLIAMRAERDELQRRLEKEEVQHAGCLTAAEGWVGEDPPKQGDWGWSPAFQAVLNLRNKRDELQYRLQTWDDIHTEKMNELQRQLAEARNALADARVHLMCGRLPGAHRTDMPLSIIDKALGNDAARIAQEQERKG